MDDLTGILKRAGYDQKPQLRGIVQSNASTLGLPEWQAQSPVDPTKMVLPYGSSGEVHSQLFPVADLIAETIGTGVYKATGSPALGFAAEILSPSPTGIVKGLAKAVRGGGDDVARKIFQGEKSATWDKAAAARARTMEVGGHSPERIWEVTGTVKGPDGKWRQEIPDVGSKLHPAIESGDVAEIPVTAGIKVIGDEAAILRHPELQRAYPELSDIYGSVDFTPMARYGGQYYPGSVKAIKASGSIDDGRSIVTHELQHGVQDREGFAMGGSPGQFASGPMFSQKAQDLTADLSQNLTGGVTASPGEISTAIRYGDPSALTAIANKHGFNSIDDAMAFISKEDARRTPFGQYQRLFGEAEARLAQARMDMTPEQLRAQYPYEPAYFEKATGVPLSELIVRGPGGRPMAMMKSGAFDVGEISAEAKRGLKEYQAAAYGSEVGGYAALQNYLRTGATKRYGVEHSPETLNTLIAGVDDGLAKSVLKQPVDLYRGVRDARQIFGQNMENLKVGHVFQDAGYVSTTTDKKIATSKFAAALNRGDKPLVFHIKGQPGLNAFDMDTIEKIGEKEVLLPRNLPLKITSIKGSTVTVEPVVDHIQQQGFGSVPGGGPMMSIAPNEADQLRGILRSLSAGERVKTHIPNAIRPTDAQRAGLQDILRKNYPSATVGETIPYRTQHAFDSRIIKDGFSPEQVTDWSIAAAADDAVVRAMPNDRAALSNTYKDPAYGDVTVRMPVRADALGNVWADDVIPEGVYGNSRIAPSPVPEELPAIGASDYDYTLVGQDELVNRLGGMFGGNVAIRKQKGKNK